MTDFNSQHNRAVWFDIPVVDLDRAAGFYRAVLGAGVDVSEFEGFRFGVLEHKDGNGGCLIPNPSEITDKAGVLVYLNADGRIREAAAQVVEHGGEIVEPVQQIGEHGYRAVIKDSEGNRMALHSQSDA